MHEEQGVFCKTVNSWIIEKFVQSRKKHGRLNLVGPKGGWALEAHPAGLGPSTEEALGALGLAQRRGPLDRNSGGLGAGAGALCESTRGRGVVETKQRMQERRWWSPARPGAADPARRSPTGSGDDS